MNPAKPIWNCKPNPHFNSLDRTGYLSGYSDGFHGYHFGAGYEAPRPATYAQAYRQAQIDAGRPREEWIPCG